MPEANDPSLPSIPYPLRSALQLDAFNRMAVGSQLYPEWPLAATSRVPRDLRIRVAAALQSLTPSHPAVRSQAPAPREQSPPCIFLCPSRRVLWDDAARLPFTISPRRPQAVSAGYATWDPPLSYSSVTLLNPALGVYRPAAGKCLKDSDLSSAISCPDGYYRRPDDEIASRCAEMGLKCPDSYTCLCSPCLKADEFQIFYAK